VRPTIIIPSLLTAAFLAAGCGSEEKAGDTTQTSQQASDDGQKTDKKKQEQPKKKRPKSNEPTAAAGAKSKFEGVYAATFTKKDGFRPGRWRLRFAGTTVRFRPPGAQAKTIGAGSPAKITASSITLKPAEVCERQVTGKYKVALVGERLQFKLTKDECERRTRLLTRGRWTKVPT
jgi:hypothetical protein